MIRWFKRNRKPAWRVEVFKLPQYNYYWKFVVYNPAGEKVFEDSKILTSWERNSYAKILLNRYKNPGSASHIKPKKVFR